MMRYDVSVWGTTSVYEYNDDRPLIYCCTWQDGTGAFASTCSLHGTFDRSFARSLSSFSLCKYCCCSKLYLLVPTSFIAQVNGGIKSPAARFMFLSSYQKPWMFLNKSLRRRTRLKKDSCRWYFFFFFNLSIDLSMLSLHAEMIKLYNICMTKEAIKWISRL